jgi:hypothetical protein
VPEFVLLVCLDAAPHLFALRAREHQIVPALTRAVCADRVQPVTWWSVDAEPEDVRNRTGLRPRERQVEFDPRPATATIEARSVADRSVSAGSRRRSRSTRGSF